MQDKIGNLFDRSLPGGQLPAKYADLGDGTYGLVTAPDARKYALRIDHDAGGLVTYIGEAVQGTTDAQAKWRIRQVQRSGALFAGIVWANGRATFENIWNNRAALSYS